jgi:PGF-CTERM protein
MKRIVAIAVVMLFGLSVLTAPVLAQAKAPEGSALPRDEATPDGLYWCNDRQLTDNGAEDRIPQIVVDAVGISHVIWFRGGSYSGQYMYKKIDRLGNELIAEKQIASGTIPEQYSGFVSPSIGIDSKSNFHIIMEPGGYGVAYAKYDANGNNLVPQKTVPSGASGPHNPSIAVSRNDIVHVIYEDYRFGYGAEAITYARLLSDGTIDKDGVRISEASWYCEGSTLCTDYANNIHATFINTAQGVYHGKLDNYGNPLPQAPPTYLYRSGTFWTDGPPYVGADGTGGVHIIWNDKPSGIGTVKYMKLDNNGKKLASGPDEMGIPLTASPTCVRFPYIAGDSRGNAYAIWADNRNGNNQIWYLKLEPGRENDTDLPSKAICLTKDVSGSAVEPKVALDPDDNLHVVWKDTRTGNPEIFYKFAYNYGVETGMTPEEMYKVMYVHPNETRTANITVRNTGGLNDTVHLNLTVDLHGHKGWKVKVEALDFGLKPQEARRLKVSVTGAPEGMANDYIDTKVVAVSDGNPRRNSTVAFRTYLVVDERLKLECTDRVHQTQAGVPTVYTCSLQNIGDIKLDINLTANGPPEWEVSLARGDVLNLKPGASIDIILTVTPPVTAMADEVGVASVTARSIRNPGVKDSIVTHTVVSPSIYIELACPDAEREVEPGNATSYQVFVSNVGNLAGTVIIILEIVSGTGAWQAELDANAVGVAGMETKAVQLTVVAPADAKAGDRLVVRVVGFNEERTMSDDVTTTTLVKQVHKLLIAVNPDRQVADPGATVTYAMTVQNAGNGPEEMSISTHKLDVNWKMRFVRATAEITDLYLDAAQSVSFEVVITVPTEALAGDHLSAVAIMDTSKELWTINLITSVKHIYDLDLTTTLSKQQGSPGKSVFFTILTRNRGNGADTIAFTASRLPPGWTMDFKDTELDSVDAITLNATEVGKTYLIIGMPMSSNSSSQEVLVTGTSESGLTDQIKFVVDMMLPDLYLSGLSYSPKRLVAGKAATVKINVFNQGEVNVENVTIRFYEGGTILGTERLVRMPANSNKTATFTWVPQDGRHGITFKVDPDNTLVETDEKNNQVKETVTVYKSSDILPGFEPLLVVVALAAASLLLVRRRRQ